ncbi:transcription factor grauzone-like [Phlebotomus argentipes]|uniref:transcription factor grauzone-like n=1 Tax=Phlebotomus argentipes TaxID=94469 RepID=UPI002892CA6E|nr:transcription factor grauzone-like [Phlebotomus argentipes]
MAKLCVKFVGTIRQSELTLQSLYGDLRDVEIKPEIEMVDIKTLPVEVEIESDGLEEITMSRKRSLRRSGQKESVKPPPKKRGRPRKQPMPEIKCESDIKPSSPEPPSPVLLDKLSPSPTSPPTSPYLQESSSDEDEDEDKIPVKVAKKRGRPRKGTVIAKRENPVKRIDRQYNKELAEENIRKIEEFFKMDCNLCQQSYTKLRDLQAHYREVHKRKGYVVCCNVKFNRPSKILQHFDHHMNPEAFKCSDCGKSFKNKYGLRLHTENSHTPPELHKYKCPNCPKTFMSMIRYKKHSFVHVTDAEKSHICPHCSKAFAFKANLQIHIRQMHEEVAYHVCEICAKMFKNKDVFLRHQKIHTGEKIEKLPCPVCGNSFKYKAQLKLHMKRHNDSGQVFRCHLCNKESPNSLALHEHIKYVHVRERKHKCNLCSSAFKTPIGLREHMATHTSSQILYTCLFCPKQFNSNANKYVHQKRKHPVEYEAMKQKKTFENLCDMETNNYADCGQRTEPKAGITNCHGFVNNIWRISIKMSLANLELKCEVKTESTADEEELCRFCAQGGSQYSSIFKENLNESLSSFLGISVQESDNWPKFICQKCWEAAKVSVDFMSSVRRAETTFRTLFGELAEAIVTKPDIELIDVKNLLIDSEMEDNNSDEVSPEESPEPLEKRRGKRRRATHIKDTANPAKCVKRKRESVKSVKAKEVLVKCRRSPSILDEEEQRIKEFFKLECRTCNESFDKLRDFRAHGLKVHKEESFIMCCDKKLDNRTKIVTHLNSHINPNAFKCEKCEKSFLTKMGLIKHELNKHVPPEQHIYKCDKCPSTFMTLCRARTHEAKHMNEEEKRFKCPQCEKAYAFNAMLKQHMRHAHDESNRHVCEICAKVFKSKYTYQIHLENHMDNGTRDFPCPMCGKAFKRKRLLKVHVERHNKTGEIFKCDMCGKVSPNRNALKNHIEYSHLKVRKFECNLCSSAFKTALGLKEHVATHSSSQILYTCLFCPKQFNSNANKYVHQKRKHPVEYEAMQKSKAGK